jgi:DNA-binding response OmpR family regulator
MGKKKILVVDDAEQVRQILSFVLTGKGYDVTQASDGNQALLRVEEETPDLIILDAMMPGRTGFDVAGILKGDARTRPIPIVMLTALPAASAEDSASDEYVSKPFQLKDLLARVEHHLAGAAERDRAHRA